MFENSSNKLIVKLKVSIPLALVLTVLHLGPVVIVWVLNMPTALRAALTVLLLAGLGNALARHALRVGPGAVESVRLAAEGELMLRHRGHRRWWPATIRSRFVHRWIVLLSVRAAGRRFPTTLVLAADAMGPDVFRRLRAALLAPPRNRGV